MNFQNNREVTITYFDSRKAKTGKQARIWWDELATGFQVPVRGTETQAEYFSWPKKQQDDAKDCGAYIGGALKGNTRKVGNVEYRSFISLDIDKAPPNLPYKVSGLGTAYIMYTTRKNTPVNPRWRILWLPNLSPESSPSSSTPLCRCLTLHPLKFRVSCINRPAV